MRALLAAVGTRGDVQPALALALERINHNRLRLGMDPIDDVLEYVLTDHTWLAADAALVPVDFQGQ
jgi:hypothetical protein